MDTSTGTQTQDPTDSSACDGCDIVGVACATERYKKQAEVAEESAQALEGFQEKYDLARAAYSKARADAEADVAWSKKTLYGKDSGGKTSIKERLKCLLDDDQRKCLKESLRTVTAAITECSGASTTGCCVGDCDYPHEPSEDETVSSLAGLIAKYRAAATWNQACFGSLIDLATEIPQQTSEIRAAVAKLDEESKSASKENVVALYATYLVLKHRLAGGGLFGGFAHVNAYMDCLCKALQCSYAAWQAVIELEGRRALLECQDKAARDECDRKKREILEDLLGEYEKCKPAAVASSDHDEDCGCGQHSHTQQPASAL
ncbi:hypothetical protein [Nocardioides sp. zg-1230]|uniref:hypothetical protein n=1 Tax=Nocardioides sp. zg-1230 TaxID=2736601 RepID=UPI001552D1F7|nr:hypothetical protein [Nocardioides sp. zg-1230]NPC44577.1 hypothetical protein [Nocardioides sp. zg-1230]